MKIKPIYFFLIFYSACAMENEQSPIRITIINNVKDTTEKKRLDPLQTDFQRVLNCERQSPTLIPYTFWKVFLAIQRKAFDKVADKNWIIDRNKEVVEDWLKIEEKISREYGALIAFNKNKWSFYDTKLGLYYLQPTNMDMNGLFRIEDFNCVLNPEEIQTFPTDSQEWAKAPKKLIKAPFDANGSRYIFHLNGHATEENEKDPVIAGLKEADFSSFLSFLNEHFKKATVAIESCHISPARILKQLNCYLSVRLITSVNNSNLLSFADKPPEFTSSESKKRKYKLRKTNEEGTFFDLIEKVHKTLEHDKKDLSQRDVSLYTRVTKNVPAIVLPEYTPENK